MYLTPGLTYYRGTDQYRSRGPYLILFSTFAERYSNGKPRLYAAVRKVALQQCGHFMMGTARIANVRIPISGSCGSDGLPRDYDTLPPSVRAYLTEVPEDVATLYWADDGHNTIGRAAKFLLEWATRTFPPKPSHGGSRR